MTLEEIMDNERFSELSAVLTCVGILIYYAILLVACFYLTSSHEMRLYLAIGIASSMIITTLIWAVIVVRARTLAILSSLNRIGAGVEYLADHGRL